MSRDGGARTVDDIVEDIVEDQEVKKTGSTGFRSYLPSMPTFASVKERAASLRQNASDFGKVVAPYFTRENATQIGFTVAANVVPAVISGIITSSFAQGTDEEQCPAEQGMFSPGTAMVAIIPIISIATRLTANSLFGQSLRNGITKNLVDELGEDKMMVLKDHTSQGVQGLPPVPEILLQHTSTFANNAVPLTIGMAGAAIDTAIMFYTGYNMVGGKAAIASSAASIAAAGTVIGVGNLASSIWKKDQASGEEMGARLKHADTNRSQIAALNAEDHEREALLELLGKQDESKLKASSIQLLSSCISMSAFFAYPQILRSLPVGSFYADGTTQGEIDVFSAQALHSMAAMRDMTAPLTKGRVELGISMGKIRALQDAIDEVHEFQQTCPLTINYETGDSVKFTGFSLAKPPKDDKSSLKDKVAAALSDEDLSSVRGCDLELESGTVYRLAGESGLGKSTLLKTCTGSWPYASGTIDFPCRKDEVYFMPQETFMPHKASLLEIMVYPRKEADISQVEKGIVSVLMDELGLGERIPDLDKADKKDWSTMSRGEQQRVALVRMLMSEVAPKVLLMDEATASVDGANIKTMHRLIKEALPDATIVYIDHGTKNVDLMKKIDLEQGVQEQQPLTPRSTVIADAVSSHYKDARAAYIDTTDNFYDQIITIDKTAGKLVLSGAQARGIGAEMKSELDAIRQDVRNARAETPPAQVPENALRQRNTGVTQHAGIV